MPKICVVVSTPMSALNNLLSNSSRTVSSRDCPVVNTLESPFATLFRVFASACPKRDHMLGFELQVAFFVVCLTSGQSLVMEVHIISLCKNTSF